MPQTQPPGPGFGGGLTQVQPPSQPGAPQGNMAMNPDQLAKLQEMLKKMIAEQQGGQRQGPPPMMNLQRPMSGMPQIGQGGGTMQRALEQLQQGQQNPVMANFRRRYYGQ
jgi:hypothetical protein